MKKSNYSFLLALVLFFGAVFSACNSNDTVAPVGSEVVELPTTGDHEAEQALIKRAEQQMATAASNSALGKNKSARVADLVKFGPYDASASLTKILTNYKVVLTGFAGIPTGIYFVDVYKSEAIATVPDESSPKVLSATKAGFNNYTTFSTTPKAFLGYQNGSQFVMWTYSVVPRYNSSGSPVAYGVLPQDLTNNVFSYQYIMDI